MTDKPKIEILRFETRSDIKRPENVVDFLRFYADLVEKGEIESNAAALVLGNVHPGLFEYSVFITGFTTLEAVGALTLGREGLREGFNE